MKYTLIINDFNHTAGEQISKLGHFLADNCLLPEEGSVIVFHRHSEENVKALDSLTELIPVSRIRYVYMEQYIPEICLDYLTAQNDQSSLFLFCGDIFGNELCTRLSIRLKGCALTDITSLKITDTAFLAKKKIYSGHILGTFELCTVPCCLSVDKNYTDDPCAVSVTSREICYDSTVSSRQYSLQLHPVIREESFADANCIVICGRGLSNMENVNSVKLAAQQTNLPVAGSRPCVMNAWLPLDRLIGVSGAVLHNRLAILLGVSGAPAFYTGVEKCGHIISINNDSSAPINGKSDLAICGDCTEIFTKFTELLKEERHE